MSLPSPNIFLKSPLKSPQRANYRHSNGISYGVDVTFQLRRTYSHVDFMTTFFPREDQNWGDFCNSASLFCAS